ncbi:hypothetical protein E2I00_002951, partial [Balaenoptera physalus]
CLSALHAVSWALIFPCYWLADRLLASFIPTTYEKRQRADDPCYLQLLCTVLFTPVYLALLVASLPFALLGFLLWSTLQSARRPYVYSRLEDKGPAGGAALLSEWKGTGPGKSFCFATANLCLLPDSLARLNNVFNTQARAKEIGQRIRNGATDGGSLEDACIVRIGGDEGGRPPEAVDPPAGGQAGNGAGGGPRGQTPNQSQRDGDSGSLGSPSASRESLVKARAGADGGGGEPGANSKLPYKASVAKKAAVRRRRHPDEAFDHEVSAFFPANLDFLCLQEVFDKRAAAKLKDQLHGYFEYILYDVGVYGCHGCCSFKCLNSGLFFASRYPIMDVQVGNTPHDQRIVGYISCTHLHALPEDSDIRCEQLNMLQDWLADFRKSTSSSSAANPEELVAFDVVCGDFNFDNCSSDDKLEQQHPLFTRTLLDKDGLYDEEVCTPDNLQKVLESEEGRREYLAFPTSKSPGGGQKGRKELLKGNGRRIDYMLHGEEGLCPDWKAEVEEFSFITQLSGLTDHLPVAMRLMVSAGEEEA